MEEETFLKSYLRKRREVRQNQNTTNTKPKEPKATVSAATGNVFGQIQVLKQQTPSSSHSQEVASTSPSQPQQPEAATASTTSKTEAVRGQFRDAALRLSIKSSSESVVGAIQVLATKIDSSISRMTVRVVRELGKLQASGSGSGGFSLPDLPDSKGNKGSGKWGSRLKNAGKGILGAVVGGGLAYGASKLFGLEEDTSELVGAAGGVAGTVLASSETARKGVMNAGKWVAQNPGTAGAALSGAYAGYQGYKNASTVLDSEADTADRIKSGAHLAVSGAGAFIGGQLFGVKGAMYGAAAGDMAVDAASYIGEAINNSISKTDFGDAYQTAIGTAFDVIGAPFSEEARKRLSTTFDGVSKFVSDTSDSISEYSSKAYDATSALASDIYSSTSALASGVYGTVSDYATKAIDGTKATFASYQEQASGLVSKASSFFVDGAASVGSFLGSRVSSLVEESNAVISNLPNISSAVSDYFKDVVQQGSELQSKFVVAATSGVAAVVQPVVDAADVIGGAVDSFKALYKNFSDNFDSVKTELSRSADTIKEGAVTAASAVWQGVRAGAQRIVEGANEGVKTAPKSDTVLGNIANTVVGAASGIVKAVPKAGSDVAAGVNIATRKGSEVFGEIAASGAVSKGLGVGRFTEQEQSAIKEAQSGGERFRAGQGLTQETKDKITQTATKYGIDPSHLMSMAQMESGGNPNAVSSTGASGLFQFTGRTGRAYGITNRFDPDQNIDAAARLYKDNAAELRRRGIEPTLDNVYLAHQQGAPGASQIIKASEGKGEISAEVAQNMGLNVGAGSGSAQGFRDANAKHLAAAAKKAETVTVAADTYKAKQPVTQDQSLAKIDDKAKQPVTPDDKDLVYLGAAVAKPVADTQQNAKQPDTKQVKDANAKHLVAAAKKAEAVTVAAAADDEKSTDKNKQQSTKPALDTSKVITSQGEIGRSSVAISEAKQNDQQGLPTAVGKSVEFEKINERGLQVSQVEITNMPEQAETQTPVPISGNHGGSVGRSAPFIDEIPLIISDMGLVLLQTGHI